MHTIHIIISPISTCYILIFGIAELYWETEKTDYKYFLRDSFIANVSFLSEGGDAVHLQDRVLPRPLLALPQLPAQVFTST